MLQFILEPNASYSMSEMAQMAIEGGCAWVRLAPGDMPDDELRDTLLEIIPLCKENGTILTIDNHVEMAKDLGLHGVHLRKCGKSPAQVREFLGPEAIIGIETPSAVAAIGLKGLDVDYVSFPSGWSIEKIAEKVSASRGAGLEIPIVADGDFSVGEIPGVLAAGASGVGIGAPIADSPDPVGATEAYLTALGVAAKD